MTRVVKTQKKTHTKKNKAATGPFAIRHPLPPPILPPPFRSLTDTLMHWQSISRGVQHSD